MIKKLAALGLIGLLFVVFLYSYHFREAQRLVKENGLPSNAVDALKHATAARGLYVTFAQLHIPNPEDKVMWLGDMNERVEHWFALDSTLEIMKDSYNNLVGVTAGKWEVEHGACKEDTVILLARNGGLKFTGDELSLSQQDKNFDADSSDLNAAFSWLRNEYYRIQSKALKRLSVCEKGNAA